MSTRRTAIPATAPTNDGTALIGEPSGRIRAAAAPTMPSTPIAASARRGWRVASSPTPMAAMASTTAIPPMSAILSLSPKVVIANDLSHSGVRSMKVLPTASNGDAEGWTSAATRWPTAIAVPAARRPLSAAAT